MLSSAYFLPPCCYCHFISVIEFYCLVVDAYYEVKHFSLNLLWFLCGSLPDCWLHLLYFLSLSHPFLILFSQTSHTKCKMMSNNLQVISAPAVFIMFFFFLEKPHLKTNGPISREPRGCSHASLLPSLPPDATFTCSICGFLAATCSGAIADGQDQNESHLPQF